MKKFSNLTNDDIKVKEIPLNIEQLIKKIINENTNIQIVGDVEQYLNSDIAILGKDELTKQVIDLIKQEEKKSELEVSESLKYNFNHFFNQSLLNKTISKLNEEYLNFLIVPSPDTIFSSEDFENAQSDTIILRTLNNIPSVYVDYLNIEESNKYFKDGNIKICFESLESVWELSFQTNLDNYGTSFSSNEEKYRLFLEKNEGFISSFKEATSALIGDAKIKVI